MMISLGDTGVRLCTPTFMEGARMLNSFVMWMCANPLEFVGGLVAGVGVFAVTMVPHLSDVHRCGHPRC